MPLHMRPFADLRGHVFGALTIIERVTNIDRYITWLCHCQCGSTNCKEIIAVRGDSIKSGHTKTCGASDGRDPIKNRRNNVAYRKRHKERLKTKESVRNVERFGQRRAWNLKHKFGMTVEQWDAIFQSQGQCCAACKATTPGGRGAWATDHCHETGELRGILCQHCNMTLGWLGDSLPKVVLYAELLITYLKQTAKKVSSNLES